MFVDHAERFLVGVDVVVGVLLDGDDAAALLHGEAAAEPFDAPEMSEHPLAAVTDARVDAPPANFAQERRRRAPARFVIAADIDVRLPRLKVVVERDDEDAVCDGLLERGDDLRVVDGVDDQRLRARRTQSGNRIALFPDTVPCEEVKLRFEPETAVVIGGFAQGSDDGGEELYFARRDDDARDGALFL